MKIAFLKWIIRLLAPEYHLHKSAEKKTAEQKILRYLENKEKEAPNA